MTTNVPGSRIPLSIRRATVGSATIGPAAIRRDVGPGRAAPRWPARARGAAGVGHAAHRCLDTVLNGRSVIGSMVGTRADLIDVFAKARLVLEP